jgi:hypothetical protein
VVRLSSDEKTKRDEYLDFIKRRAMKSPEFSQIIEETVKHEEELSRDKKTSKQKEQKE